MISASCLSASGTGTALLVGANSTLIPFCMACAVLRGAADTAVATTRRATVHALFLSLARLFVPSQLIRFLLSWPFPARCQHVFVTEPLLRRATRSQAFRLAPSSPRRTKAQSPSSLFL